MVSGIGYLVTDNKCEEPRFGNQGTESKNNCCNIGCKFDSQIDIFSIKNVVRKLLTDHSKSEWYQYFYTIIYQY